MKPYLDYRDDYLKRVPNATEPDMQNAYKLDIENEKLSAPGPNQDPLREIQSFVESPPHYLIGTSGVNWAPQYDNRFLNALGESINNKYVLKTNDKSKNPISMTTGGPGTGKSFHSNFFLETCRKSTQGKPVHQYMEGDFWEFKITFENGSALRSFEEADKYSILGSRMLRQLTNKDASVDAVQVLETLAQKEGKELKEIKAAIIVDGAHSLTHEQYKKLYSDLQNCVNNADMFVLGSISATVIEPENNIYMSKSGQLIIQHTPTTLLERPTFRDGTPVFEDYPANDLLIEDCGGHGRLLEMLSEAENEVKIPHNDPSYVKTIAEKMLQKISDRYRYLPNSEEVRYLLSCTLTQTQVDLNQVIPGSKHTIGTFVNSGFFRYNLDTEKITLPYFFLWKMAKIPGLRLDIYEEYTISREKANSGIGSWKTFELFVASFRSLKSYILQGQRLTVREMHAGAWFDDSQDSTFNEFEVKKMVIHQSKNKVEWTQGEKCDQILKDGTFLIMNGDSASAPSIFARHQLNDGSIFTEGLQPKRLISSKLSPIMIKEERDKSIADKKNDSLIIITPRAISKKVKPIPGVGIVYDRNFRSYFGPYTGRAFRSYPLSKSLTNTTRSASFHTGQSIKIPAKSVPTKPFRQLLQFIK